MSSRAFLCLPLLVMAATSSAAHAGGAHVHHSPSDGSSCYVGTVGIDLTTYAATFISFEGSGMWVFSSSEDTEGTYHCKGEIPLGEVADGYDIYTRGSVTAYVLSFDELCDAFPGACKAGKATIDSDGAGGIPIVIEGVLTYDWTERISEDGDAMIKGWFGD